MMCDVTGEVSGANHWMSHIIDDKDQATIFSLWNDDSMLIWQSPFLKHNMSSSCPLYSLCNALCPLRLLSNLVSMHSCTIDSHFTLDLKLLAFNQILNFRAHDLSIFVFKLLKLGIIG